MNYCGTVGCTLGSFVASGLGEKHGIEAKVINENCKHSDDGSTVIKQELDFHYNGLSFNRLPLSFAKVFFGLSDVDVGFLFTNRSGYHEDDQEGKDESIRRIKWLLSGKTPEAYEEKYPPYSND